MSEGLPEAARNLILSIDLQLTALPVNQHYQNDQAVAFGHHRRELEEWKRRILADPSSVVPTQARKRQAAEIDDDDNNDPETILTIKRAKQAKPKKREPTFACNACLDMFFAMQTVPLRCCSARYCRSCFLEFFNTPLKGTQLPTCCGIVIKLEDYSKYLKSDVQTKYQDVAEELKNVNLLRCSNSRCNVVLKVSQLLLPIISNVLMFPRVLQMQKVSSYVENVGMRHAPAALWESNHTKVKPRFARTTSMTKHSTMPSKPIDGADARLAMFRSRR